MENNSIRIISVEFKKIKVNKFLPKEKTVEFSIFFDDGYDKEIIRSINLNNVKGVAENIVDDILRMEKNINRAFDGETLLENFVKVVVKDKESLLIKMNEFLKQVNENIDTVRACQTAEGYLDLISKVNKMFSEF